MKGVPLLTIRQMRAVDAVANHASLVRASEQLSASQSSLSRSIAEAERSLGHRLFQRGWAGMEPTSQGEIVIAHCRRAVSDIDAAQALLRAAGARVGDLGHHLTWHLLGVADAVQVMGGVSAAAEYLNISQPQVSRALAKLTAALGRPPFRRTRTGMAATSDAAILSDLRSKVLSDVLPMPALLEALSGELTGRVAVGLLPFSEQDVVVKAFGVMLRRHRHVRLQAVTGSYAALTDGLRQGELDFVLGPLRSPPPYDTLEEMHLYDEFFAIVARASHPIAQQTPSLADLLNENWVVAPHGTPTRQYFEDFIIQNGLTPPTQTCEIVTFYLAEQMLINSDAIGLLTYSANKIKNIRDGLSIIPMYLPNNARKIGLTYRRNQQMTRAQGQFVNIILEFNK